MSDASRNWIRGAMLFALLSCFLPAAARAEPTVVVPGYPMIEIDAGQDTGLESGMRARVYYEREIQGQVIPIYRAWVEVKDVLEARSYLRITEQSDQVAQGDRVEFVPEVLDGYLSRAELSLAANQLETADQIVGQALRLDPDHAGGLRVREEIARKRQEQRRQAERLARADGALADASRLSRAGQLEAAAKAIREAQGLGKSGGRVDELRLSIARQHLQGAEAHLGRGEWGAAEAEVAAAERIAGSDLATRVAESADLRLRIRAGREEEASRLAAEQAREREAARLARRIEKLRAELATDRLEAAIGGLRELRREEGETPAVLALVEDAVVASAAAVDAARARGELEEAIRIVRRGRTVSRNDGRLSDRYASLAAELNAAAAERESVALAEALGLAKPEVPAPPLVVADAAEEGMEDGRSKTWWWVGGGALVAAGGVLYLMAGDDKASLEVTVDIP